MNKDVNCKEICWLRKLCYAKGEVGRAPFECPNAWRIEEIMADERNDLGDEPEEEGIDE